MNKATVSTILGFSLLFMPLFASAQSISQQLQSIQQAAMQISSQIDAKEQQETVDTNESTVETNQCSDLRAENERLRDRIAELEEENDEVESEESDEESLSKTEQRTRNIEDRLLSLTKDAFDTYDNINRQGEVNYSDWTNISYSEREQFRDLWRQYDHSEQAEAENEWKPEALWGGTGVPEEFAKDFQDFVEERREVYEIENQ